MSVQLNVHAETDRLEAVIVGLAQDIGTDFHQNNPKIQQHVAQGTAPTEASLVAEVENFVQTLEQQGVTVYRPENLADTLQIFTRDIAFVIDDTWVKANMRKAVRQREYQQIVPLLADFGPARLLTPPPEAVVEGGDVLLHGDYIFVGQSDRTNRAGADFLTAQFPTKTVIPFELTVTDSAASNILHLDCAFQPVGGQYAILYEAGFQQRPDSIFDLFGEENLIRVTQAEMVAMHPNIFSISPTVVISTPDFTRLNQALRARGLTVIEVAYAEVSKLGGLLRCSTLPLRRG